MANNLNYNLLSELCVGAAYKKIIKVFENYDSRVLNSKKFCKKKFKLTASKSLYWQLFIEATRSSVRYYSYWNKANIFCLEALACASIDIDACCNTCVLARFALSAAKSASSILPFAKVRFVAMFERLAIV